MRLHSENFNKHKIMKSIRTIMLAGLMVPLLAMAEGKSVPYASGLYQDADWTMVDVNDDGKKWDGNTTSSNFTGSGYTSGICYTYNGTKEADDWYISPAIHLEAGKEYKVKFWAKNTYPEKLELMMAQGSDVNALRAGVRIGGFEEVKHSKTEKLSYVFTPEATADYYIALHCYSAKNQGWLYVTGFEIAENVFAPAAVSGLTCTPGEDRALTATLNWTLPTTDNDGAALPDGASFDEVTIARDGRVVATLAGTATVWTDDASKGLTSGKHKYEVTVVVNGAKSAPTAVESKYIGPIEAMALPYDGGLKTLSAEDFELFWTPVKGRDSQATDTWKYFKSYSSNGIQYCGGSGKTQDDWVISPEMKFTEAGVYRLKVTMSYNNSSKTDFDILLGTGASIGGYENVIKNFKAIPSSDTEYEIFFEVAEPGNYGIAFHAHGEPSYYTYFIKSFEVAKWKLTPAHVTDLTVTVAEDGNKVNLAWTNPTTTNTGAELTALEKVELYCNDELVETFAESTPGQAMTYQHTPATSGIHTYHVLGYSAEGAADGEPMKVSSSWVGDETQELPYTTSFATSDVTSPIWSGYHAGNYDTEWTINGSAKIAKPSDYVTVNDYLLSPYFELKAGYYTLTYSIKGAGKNFTVKAGTVSDKNNVKATFVEASAIKLPGQSWASDYKVTVKVDEAGKYAFALLANDYMSPDDYALEVTKFSAAYQPVYPDLATNVTVTPAADLSNAATISWTNPSTTNIEGIAATIVKAEIMRDGEKVGEVTEGLEGGKESSYEDTTVPNAGEYTYSVVIYGPEGASTEKATEVKSPWIGAGMDMPYSCADGFRDAGWTIFNVNNDKYSWGDAITWETYSGFITITSNNTTPDDWAITPRLNFVAGKTYVVTIESSYGTGYSAVAWDLHHGTAVDPEAMTTKIATINTNATSSTPQTDEFKVMAVDPSAAAVLAEGAETDNVVNVPAGVGTLGLHANNKGAFRVSKFEVKEQIGTGIESVTGDGTLSVNGTTIDFGGIAESVAVTDLAGKTLMSESGVESIDLESLASGVYVVSARVNGKIVAVKVAK